MNGLWKSALLYLLIGFDTSIFFFYRSFSLSRSQLDKDAVDESWISGAMSLTVCICVYHFTFIGHLLTNKTPMQWVFFSLSVLSLSHSLSFRSQINSGWIGLVTKTSKAKERQIPLFCISGKVYVCLHVWCLSVCLPVCWFSSKCLKNP